MKPTDTFMDETHAVLFQDKLLGMRLRPESKRVLVNYRNALRRARRFVLDDDTVRLICHLSHERDRLPGWSFLARLPYDPIWIEFNLHTKLDEFAAMNSLRFPFNPDEVSRDAALLMYHDKDSTSRWVCHVWRRIGDDDKTADPTGRPHPGLLTYVFDPEGTGLTVVRGSTAWNSLTLSLRPNIPKVPVRIVAKDGRTAETHTNPENLCCGMWEEQFSLKDGLGTPEWFTSKAGVIPDPFWESWCSDKQTMMDGVWTELNESKGELRWIVTLLAAINALPRDIKPISSRVGHRQVGMNMLPYFSHHSISLTLPRDDRVVRARRMMDKLARNAQKRWHEVMGHWRVIEFGKIAPRSCRHAPVMVENGLGICEHCELLVRWIPSQTRGSPELGMIDHTYNVHAKRQLRAAR